MSRLDPRTVEAGTGEDEDLRKSIEHTLARAGESGLPVAAIHRRRFPGSTSYASEIVTVELATGDAIEIFLKDFGQSRLPKDQAAKRRERELRVYEELLEEHELGTAHFFGSLWDEDAARFWLMLEFVDGELLRDCSFEWWLPAAAWLGRLHGHFSGQRDRLRACGFLVRHDAAFFLHAAERALRTLSAFSGPLARRLAAVLDVYDPILAVLTRDSDTLVHGSYRPQNVLVVQSSQPPRICPTDWELAAFGRSTFDLAFLCDGFRPPRLDALFDAYEREAATFGLALPNWDEVRHEVDCFRLHKTVNSLGNLRNWPRPARTSAKVVATAEDLVSTLT
jgi:hypothetical protein